MVLKNMGFEVATFDTKTVLFQMVMGMTLVSIN